MFLAGSCSLFTGSDGDDGRIHLAIDWIEQPVYYTDTNPSIPQSFVRKQFYPTEPGVYSFEYAFDDEFGWEGFYELKEAEPGKNGKVFWKNGRDGKSVFYTLMLSYRGTGIDNYYEKARSDATGYHVEEIVDGLRITIYARKVPIDDSFRSRMNKMGAVK